MVSIYIVFLLLLVILSACVVVSFFVYKRGIELSPYARTIEELKTRIIQFQSNIAMLNNELKELIEDKEDAQKIIKEAKGAEDFLNKHEETIAEFKKEYGEFIKDIEEQKKKQEKLQENQKMLKEEIDECELRKALLNKTIDQLEKTIKEQKNNIATLNRDLDNLKSAKNRVSLDVDSLNNKKKYLEDNISRLERELNKKLADNDELENIIKDNRKQIATLKKDLHDSELKKSKLDKSVDQLEKTINEQNNDISTLKRDIDNLKSEKSKLSSDVDSLNNEKKSICDNINQLEKELYRKEAENDELSNVIKDNREQIAELNKELQEYKIDLGQKQAQESVDDKKWEDLDREVVSYKTNAKTKFNESSWLYDFKIKLKSNDIYFNDRIINAFHTSLKIGDKSPLVVLAGISGTGKSLLPQLYATAIGMNYLNVAVQPRWDSPQDMLGFYNYMQNRYKATELSRLLWQFDIYNNASLKKVHGINNENSLPMNLVLLDEMNLAKVEYYFSDMLSKLEVRRTITASNDEQRRKAEIEIECASLSSNKASRRLFVNNNTLFVGTMNEDETTQSLSDKVLDRANMLRFGKPKSLQANANIQKFMDSYSSDEYLSLGKWREINNQSNILSSVNEEKLKRIINGINGELEKVGRPFAHRVYQSIRGYVTAYPNVNIEPKAFDNAIADQIEMKILPKLNGLEKSNNDVSEALKNIKDFIDRTRDSELIAEYEKSIKDDGTDFFYKWKGVVRS